MAMSAPAELLWWAAAGMCWMHPCYRAVARSVQCLTQMYVQVNTIEEVDEQRQFIEALPRKVRELMLEVDASKVGLKGSETAILSLPSRCLLLVRLARQSEQLRHVGSCATHTLPLPSKATLGPRPTVYSDSLLQRVTIRPSLAPPSWCAQP